MCRIEDSESWVSLTNVERTARKAHQCFECNRTITPGERYRYVTGVGYDGFDVFRHCAHCDAASEWLIVACSGFLYGVIADELREHRDEEPELRSPMLDALIDGIEHGWWGGKAVIPSRREVADSIPTQAWSGYYRRVEELRVEADGQMALTDA